LLAILLAVAVLVTIKENLHGAQAIFLARVVRDGKSGLVVTLEGWIRFMANPLAAVPCRIAEIRQDSKFDGNGRSVKLPL
jgi:hypothetical protein